jgi:UDP-N-acetylmuramate: L-alanyl-gamma-D-glutamyl-meso-diaminopimelate ligase
MVSLGARAAVYDNLDQLIAAIKDTARPGDHVLVMSNGAFGGLHERLLKTLDNQATDIRGGAGGG